MNIHQMTALTIALLGERVASHLESGNNEQAIEDAMLIAFGGDLLTEALAREFDVSPDKLRAMRALLETRIAETPDDDPDPEQMNVVANFLRQRNKADLN